MNDQITKGIIGLIVVIAGVSSVFYSNIAADILVPIATLVIGYYFRDSKIDIMARGRLAKIKKKA